MKKIILIAVAVFVGGSLLSARADDTPAQAAARAALDKLWNNAGNAPAQPAPGNHSDVATDLPGKSVLNDANLVTRTEATPQTAPGTPIVEIAATPTAAENDHPDLRSPADDPASAMADFAIFTTTRDLTEDNELTPAFEVTPAADPSASATPVIPAHLNSFYPAAGAAVGAAARTTTQSTRTVEKVQPGPAPVVAKRSIPLAPAKPADEIVTTDGTIYSNPYVERVLSDGIIVSYSTASGGMGITKLFFDSLPDAVRRRYQKP